MTTSPSPLDAAASDTSPQGASPSRGWRDRLTLVQPTRWGAAAVAVVMMVLMAVHWLFPPTGHSPGRVLTQARMQRVDLINGITLDVAQAVTLPFELERGLPPKTGLRVQLTLDAPPPQQSTDAGMLGLYIPQFCAAARVILNGQLIYERGQLLSPVLAGCLQPLVVPMPPGLLQTTGNTIRIDLAGPGLNQTVSPSHAVHVAPVYVGPLDSLIEQGRHTQMWRLGAPLGLAAICGLIGLAALVLGGVSRLPYLGYFGLTGVTWAMANGLMAGVEMPIPDAWANSALAVLVVGSAVSAVIYLLRYCGLGLPWLELSLALQCAVVALSLTAAGADRVHLVAPPWFLIVSIELMVAWGLFLYRAKQLSPPDFWVGTSAALVLGFSLLIEGVLPDHYDVLPGRIALSLALITLFGGMAWRMHQLFQNALVAVELARLDADRRVQEVRAEMEQNFGQMAELRVEQVTARERKRIAADLHDDLGAKLLTIVHTSDNDRIATLAREALEEMRLSVRGLTGRAVQLGDAIGDWRSEVVSRLQHGGVSLNWDTPDELLMSERTLSARAYVQTTRILREAVSNVLKHSGASRCDISIRQEADDFEMTIADNGHGIPMEMDGKLDRGHGMSTMKGRAKQLQGQCLVESGPGFGTMIRLNLPL